ncbi:hypothetical protein BKA70DRAFT_1235295 [Coprinopsis sp. MPI-PUGE-AT-0042]|nr:hypothetical protein BKA70DRAFT_1235295 [Coprinopsis sp. MPI-PUGE-AT-0042]
MDASCLEGCNFQKGERQMNMDYALSESLALNCSERIGRVIITYDINCQYNVHLMERLKEGKYLQIRDNLVFVYGIGLFHVHGHQDSCYWRYALTFIRGAGMASGEILESLWAVINEVARTTSTMTLAHRQEVIDAVIGDSNWKKMLNIGALKSDLAFMPQLNYSLVPALCKNWANSRLQLARANEAFELLNETASPQQRQTWSSQLERAHEERSNDPSAMDVLEVKINKPPTQTAVQHTLMEKEQSENSGLGITSWLVAGMKIQESQERVRALVRSLGVRKSWTDLQRLEVTKKREQLQLDVNNFYENAILLFPEVNFRDIKCDTAPEESVEIDGEDDSNEEAEVQERNRFSVSQNQAEDIELPLPSTFPSELPPSMDAANDFEIKLRVAQADDFLENIRTDIGHKSFLYRSNIRLAEGKRLKTRGYDTINAVDANLRLNIKIYHQARWALRRLCVGSEILNRYRKITKPDTWAITSVYQPNARGLRNEHMSWIWTIDVDRDCQKSEYLEELYQVNWLRAKSRAERWCEEHQLLTCEMGWVLNFFSFKTDQCKAWANLKQGFPGHVAYARRRAEMWRVLGVHAERQFQRTKEPYSGTPII